ncbi:MAG: ABC transporter ATP-binding protein [Lachnospiraceae bacterium]|jgi:ABC-2 type transport system ATP-binding protein|nr:ABC transporter ATP-binding protein [Lachnospiraceae bacterium]MEE3461232.1 ABC transporter ATP-binding protein [Lachnospiraceae bacterium]
MYVEVNDVSKVYSGNKVLDNVSMSFERGKIYGICGRNGSGKTQLLKAIAGLISLSSGTIKVGGEIIGENGRFPEDVSALIEAPGFISNMTGYKNLCILADIRKRTSHDQIKKYMIEFGLDPASHKKFRKYSMGMKQKIGVIAALMESSKLILLDEPTNALDEESIVTLNKEIFKEKEKGNLLIITSHDKEEINAVCDDIIYMRAGKVVENAQEIS